MKPLAHLLEACGVCPNACGVDRLAGQAGRCRVADGIVVASSGLHFGEERVLVGRGGSGTIFLAGCSLGCVYCQNWDISQSGAGRSLGADEAARMMLALQDQGAVNVNLVTPTHQAPRLFEAVQAARSRGLEIPIVYNSSGYDSVPMLRELEGLVQIYMPDLKYGSDEAGERYSGVRGYWTAARAAVAEMHRQVGDLVLGADGVARRGLLVRHLVLPGDAACSRAVVDFIAERIGPRTALNVMAQYHPAYRAREHGALGRGVLREEVEAVRRRARERGLVRSAG